MLTQTSCGWREKGVLIRLVTWFSILSSLAGLSTSWNPLEDHHLQRDLKQWCVELHNKPAIEKITGPLIDSSVTAHYPFIGLCKWRVRGALALLRLKRFSGPLPSQLEPRHVQLHSHANSLWHRTSHHPKLPLSSIHPQWVLLNSHPRGTHLRSPFGGKGHWVYQVFPACWVYKLHPVYYQLHPYIIHYTHSLLHFARAFSLLGALNEMKTVHWDPNWVPVFCYTTAFMQVSFSLWFYMNCWQFMTAQVTYVCIHLVSLVCDCSV